MKYQKKGSKFQRKYGRNIKELSKELGVSTAVLSNWERQGFDIFYKFERKRKYEKIYSIPTLLKCWQNMKSRCGNPYDKKYKHYGGKGIRIKMEFKDLFFLWQRDKAYLMKRPSIDRKDSNKDYELSNCQFIEMIDNIKNNH